MQQDLPETARGGNKGQQGVSCEEVPKAGGGGKKGQQAWSCKGLHGKFYISNVSLERVQCMRVA